MIKWITIGGLTFNIEETSDVNNQGRQWGDCNFGALRIRVAQDLPDDLRRSILFHEILHAVNWRYELDFDETQINRLEAGLTALFKDNSEYRPTEA